MAKKKVKRRMKKQVRKTLGALFLASAVAVAAIPTGSYDGGMANAGITTDADGVEIYQHKAYSNWALTGDTSQHTEDYPIVSSTAEGESGYTIRSIFVNSAKKTDYPSEVIAEPTKIPLCLEGVDADGTPRTTIYTDVNEYYRFAYVDDSGDQNGSSTKSAVILQYTNVGTLAGGVLEIPETLDAFLNLNDNAGRGTGLTAVGKAGNYLFYVTDSVTEYYTVKQSVVKEQEKDSLGNALFYISFNNGVSYESNTYTQAQINAFIAAEEAKPEDERRVILTKAAEKDVVQYDRTYYAPCTNTDYSKWQNEVTLYYYPTDDFRATGNPTVANPYDDADENGVKRVAPLPANTQQYERIRNVPVYYIGNQYLDDSGTYVKDTISKAEQGVFYGQGNITTLKISPKLVGIGDYAFYGCSMSEIAFENGLTTIGNHAFDNCAFLNRVEMEDKSNISTIGAYAFKNCAALSTFPIPATVKTIGDGAFKNCWNLKSVTMEGITHIGAYVFQNCESLESLTFPRGFTDTIELSEFEGCKALQYIRAESGDFKIVASSTCDYDWDAFHVEFNDKEAADILTRKQFYIEASNSSPLHKICRENELSFKYLDQDSYELTKEETTYSDLSDSEKRKATVTYTVDSSDTLISAVRNNDAKITAVEFPEYIGPHTIAKIGEGAFRDWCTLTEVTIDSKIKEIGASAFQGCHNLQYVFFEATDVAIGENAFLTQKVSSHANCAAKSGTDTRGKSIQLYDSVGMTDAATNEPAVKLGFVAMGFNKVDDVIPNATLYKYAMSFAGRYSNNGQAPSFADFYTGWPTMLKIQYHCTDVLNGTGYSELADFPTYAERSSYINAPYLTDEQRADASNGKSTAAQIFEESTKALTIPYAVNAIEDGLYYKKTTENGITSFPVICHGLAKIETNYKTDSGTSDGNILYYNVDTGASSTTQDRNSFPEADPARSDFAGASALTSITIDGDTTEIDAYAFQNAKGLTTVTITDSVNKIGDHAFQGDTRLQTVALSQNIEEMGIAPFKGCTSLENVSLTGNPNFTCSNSIIYATTSDGTKYGVVEVLPNRSDSIGETDMDFDITELREEAFVTTQVGPVDLTNTNIKTVPQHAFYQAEALSRVFLPDSCTKIEGYAFEKCTTNEIQAGSVDSAVPTALDGIIISGSTVTDHENTANNYKVTVRAPEETGLYRYAVDYDYKKEKYTPIRYYTVSFYESGSAETPVRTVRYVEDSTISEADVTTAEKKVSQYYEDTLGISYKFDGWEDENRKTYSAEDLQNYVVTKNVNFYAHYVPVERETYTVTFLDYYRNTNKTYTVKEGDTLADEEKDVPVLSDVTDNGVTLAFGGWNLSGDTSVTDPITANVTFTPIYTPKVSDTYTVTFRYYDPVSGKVEIWWQLTDVASGTNVSKNVSSPTISGYTFDGWENATATPSEGDITNVTCSFELMGTFTKQGSSSGDSGDSSDSSSSSTVKPSGGSNDTVEINGFTIPAYDTNIFAVALYYNAAGDPYSYRLINIGSKAPDIAKPEGYTSGYAWSPTPAETTVNDVAFFNLVPYTPSSSSNGSSSNTGTFYTLTVVNGSGSGSYSSGSTVIIVANDPVSGQEFSNWTIDPSEAKIASNVMSATTITMPDSNVSVTAHYKTKTSTSTGSGGSTSNNSGRTTNTGTVSSGTTVVIDKNGLSNTGVVSATVRGSSDNFTIKVRESTDASTAIVKALQAEYGDISGIKYFPMDISLYDATGTKLITDTTGLSINITLPLPDSLIPYAGNNKVAGVVNNRLDKLTPKFTTIDGVACVTFTAEHFSPYVIYVDTNNASAGRVITDNTPKTGDGIHPKWFLSLGLACISAVLFLKRDKKTTQRVTTA